MQITIRDRAVIAGALVDTTGAFDVAPYSSIVLTVVAHAIGGGATVTTQLQTSDDMDVWRTLTPSAVVAAPATSAAFHVSPTADAYGRYVRAEVVITGATPTGTYSLFMNARDA